MNKPKYSQISYNGSFSNTFKLNLQVIVQILLFKMKDIVLKDSAVHTIKPTQIIATSLCIASFTLLLFVINRLYLVTRNINDYRLEIMKDMRMVAVLR